MDKTLLEAKRFLRQNGCSVIKEAAKTLYVYPYVTGNYDWSYEVFDFEASMEDLQAALWDDLLDCSEYEYEEIMEGQCIEIGDNKYVYACKSESSDYYFDVGNKKYNSDKAIGKAMGLGEEADYIAESHCWRINTNNVHTEAKTKELVKKFDAIFNPPPTEEEINEEKVKLLNDYESFQKQVQEKLPDLWDWHVANKQKSRNYTAVNEFVGRLHTIEYKFVPVDTLPDCFDEARIYDYGDLKIKPVNIEFYLDNKKCFWTEFDSPTRYVLNSVISENIRYLSDYDFGRYSDSRFESLIDWMIWYYQDRISN